MCQKGMSHLTCDLTNEITPFNSRVIVGFFFIIIVFILVYSRADRNNAHIATSKKCLMKVDYI